MPRKYSLAHLTHLGWTPPEMIRYAKQFGYDYVGLRTINPGFQSFGTYDLAANATLFNETIAAMEETGVRVYDIECAKIADGIDVKSYEAAIEAASRLGAKTMVSSIWTDNKDFYLDQFAKLCELAESYGLCVDLEFVTWANVATLQDAADVLKTVKCKNAGMLIDTLHFYRSRVSVEELKSCSTEWFRYVHICDAPEEIPADAESLIHTGRDAREYIGEGAIDVAGIIKALPDSVVLAIESPHLQNVKDYGAEAHVKKCISSAKEYFKNCKECLNG